MKIIMTIRDSDFGLHFPDPAMHKERRASRAIVFDKDGKIAVLHVVKKHYHKLPGGGVEEGESIADALQRELSEEIGCSVLNVKELGIIEEFRNKFSLHQLSYCFLADLNGEKGIPHFERGEIADGFVPVWMSLGFAIKILEGETDVHDFEGKFIQVRDLAFLKEASHLVRISL